MIEKIEKIEKIKKIQTIEKTQKIPAYPELADITLEMRDTLQPLFASLTSGISEFTFANIFLFRKKHSYRIAQIGESNYIITGENDGETYFLLPFALPDKDLLKELFRTYQYMKLATVSQSKKLRRQCMCVKKNRDNFDYLYRTRDLALLAGRRYHKKRNLVTLFEKTYHATEHPVTESNIHDALYILEKWKESRDEPGDYSACREALENIHKLALRGMIVYVDDTPAAYTLGEELGQGNTFIIHFEKGISDYKGIYQYINKVFAASLKETYAYINREQDLGDRGLRQAKMSYRPAGFIRKYKIWKR